MRPHWTMYTEGQCCNASGGGEGEACCSVIGRMDCGAASPAHEAPSNEVYRGAHSMKLVLEPQNH